MPRKGKGRKFKFTDPNLNIVALGPRQGGKMVAGKLMKNMEGKELKGEQMIREVKAHAIHAAAKKDRMRLEMMEIGDAAVRVGKKMKKKITGQ